MPTPRGHRCIDLFASLWHAVFDVERYARRPDLPGQQMLFRDEDPPEPTPAVAPQKPPESVEQSPPAATITAGGTGEPAKGPKAEGLKMTVWQVNPKPNGKFGLKNSSTQDVGDRLFETEAEAQAQADEWNAAAEKIAADMRARSLRAKAAQAEIAAMRPDRMLSSGNDR